MSKNERVYMNYVLLTQLTCNNTGDNTSNKEMIIRNHFHPGQAATRVRYQLTIITHYALTHIDMNTSLDD